MRMDGTLLNEFESIMRQAQWYENKGDDYMRQPYYEEAKRWYLNAAFEYEKAYKFAESHDDYDRKQDAYYAQRNAERKRQDAIDELNRQPYGYGSGR